MALGGQNGLLFAEVAGMMKENLILKQENENLRRIVRELQMWSNSPVTQKEKNNG